MYCTTYIHLKYCKLNAKSSLTYVQICEDIMYIKRFIFIEITSDNEHS